MNNTEWLHDNLKKQYEQKLRRIQTAAGYSAAATIGVVIALIVVSALHLVSVGPLTERNQLYAQFLEWDTTGPQIQVCNWDCEIGIQVRRLFSNDVLVLASVIANDHEGNIAGIARLCTLVAVTITAAFAYRRQVAEYYSLNGQQAELNDFQATPPWEQWVSRVFYTLATLFGTYVVVSLLWLGISLAFKELSLNWFDSSIVIIGFTAVTTFVATYGALAVTTRGVLLLTLMTYGFGLSASFALSQLIDGQQWWERAVSAAGQLNPSASVFTGTFLSGSFAMVVLWFDINSMIHSIVNDGKPWLLKPAQWMIVVRVLYIIFVLGLLFVGFIRVDQKNFPQNMLFHAGGAIASISSVVMSGLLIRKRRFPPWYTAFSVYILFGVTVVIAILSSLTLNPLTVVFPGTGIISLTVMELILLMLLGVWMYITVDNLVAIENIRALAGYTDLRAMKADYST